MSRTIMLVPAGPGVGLTSVTLGVIRAIERKGVRLSVFKPIAQPRSDIAPPDRSAELLHAGSALLSAKSLTMSHVEALLGASQQDLLLEEIVSGFYAQTRGADVVLVEGLVPTRHQQFTHALNEQIARTLNAEIVFVMSPDDDLPVQLKERIELARASFAGGKNQNIIGVILNKLNEPIDEQGRIRADLSELFANMKRSDVSAIRGISPDGESRLPLLGCIPWNVGLTATRAFDMAQHLGARIINEGEIRSRRITSITFCAGTLPHLLKHPLPGSLLVTPTDRPDVFIAICLAAMSGIGIGAILLTGGGEINPHVIALCKRAFQTGLPVFMVDSHTWQTSLSLQNFSPEVPADDYQRIEQIQNYIADHISTRWIDSLAASSENPRRLSPPAFRYQLTERARQAAKRIVMPEGEEPRTVKAAAICAARGIARCVLLGNPNEIMRIAAAQGVVLGDGIDIIDPALEREKYVAQLVMLRRNKGMTEVVAREQLEDNVMLATLMLAENRVDGLVSGAVHTTANTLRPALQLIKTAPGCSLVSSVFFMLLPDQVLVYGDCAINPDPSAEQLAEIAIQSADSAAAFGIEPRVAMISYSTGTSGSGSDVDKVRAATRLVQARRPDLLIDGPLQYDAAIMADVARSKAPNSPVAGRATVFIFPDLNTGNTTYKAVQRSADLVSIGPMLQGIRRPVNDLSRGALVDDIVYTIALTAIQAAQNP
ncbi:phosphate acetyltransferase [Pantoea sp. B65]|uniref:phosphate acetyltransferase n=1 Tax=Pantoea sp. B65 TaxID=2813359 RepID=UPI0039B54F9F